MKTIVLLTGIGLALLLLSWLPWSPATAPVPATESTGHQDSVAYGRQLFFAKGCTGCHRHAALPRTGEFVAEGPPNLTGYDPDPAFVRRWLADPQAVRPGAEMPDLDLSDAEIEVLISFLEDAADSSR